MDEAASGRAGHSLLHRTPPAACHTPTMEAPELPPHLRKPKPAQAAHRLQQKQKCSAYLEVPLGLSINGTTSCPALALPEAGSSCSATACAFLETPPQRAGLPSSFFRSLHETLTELYPSRQSKPPRRPSLTTPQRCSSASEFLGVISLAVSCIKCSRPTFLGRVEDPSF